MINEKLQNAFNDQINKELYSEYLYLAMKTYFMEQNLMGFVNWFDCHICRGVQSENEMPGMRKSHKKKCMAKG